MKRQPTRSLDVYSTDLFVKNSVAARFANSYLWLLLVLESLLLLASLSLHLSVLLGAKRLFAECGALLFNGTVIVAVAGMPFVKDSLRWREQIKMCPA